MKNNGDNSVQSSIYDYLPEESSEDTSDFLVDFAKLMEAHNIPEDVAKDAADYFSQSLGTSSMKEVRRDNALLHAVIPPLLKLQYRKEGTYGDSWAKRGELEVFFNVSRKFDRLENIMLSGAIDEVGESYVDTVADLANYGLLWMTYIARTKPEAFNRWVEKENLN